MTIDEPPYDPDYDGPPTPDTGRHLHSVRPDTDERPPIRDQEAEQAVLGALILDPGLAPDLALELTGADFDEPRHETIWDACHAITATLTGDLKLDSSMLTKHLADTGQLGKIGGAPYLLELTNACPLTTNAPYYAARVRDAARLRQVQTLGTSLLDVARRGDTTQLEAAFTAAYEKLDTAAARIGPLNPAEHNRTGLHDLSWVLSGVAPSSPPPVYVQRTDGTALFYRGRVNGVFGDPESGKTWLAQVAIIEALNNGDTAAMIDVDHNGADHTAARLLLLGARLEHLADPTRFRYYEPDDADELRAAVTDITTWAPAVLVLDSIGEMLPMLGVKSVDNDEITAALRTIAMPPAKAGCAVITIDHLPKSTEARVTGYAIGGTAKKRAVDGAYLRAEAKVKPTPGGIGRITLRIEKDRTGELRKSSHGGYAGTFTLDSTTAAVTTWTIGREDSPITDDGRFRPTHLMEAVSRYVEDSDVDPSKAQIEKGVRGGAKGIRAAIECLLDEGFLTAIKGLRGDVYHSTIHYREDEDDQSE